MNLTELSDSSNSSSSFKKYISSSSNGSSSSSSSSRSSSRSLNVGDRIGVFGLSGNPPHAGHEAIVRYLSTCSSFDAIWIIPVYKHMYSSKQSLARYEDRLEMCQRCFSKYDTIHCAVRVLDIEKECSDEMLQATQSNYHGQQQQQATQIGTIDVLNYIKANTASLNLDLHLILSSETYNDLVRGKWKRSQDIINIVKLQVLLRKGYPLTDQPTVQNIKQTYHSNVSIPEGVSSTAIRNYDLTLLEFFGIFNRSDLDPSVFDYIRTKRLFFFQHDKTTIRIRALSLMTLSLASFAITLILSSRKH